MTGSTSKDKDKSPSAGVFSRVSYNGSTASADLIAALIVTILLVPQSIAYAMLAGLPPKMGIYASILPLVAYALIGSSRYISIGPTAVISLMTATAIAALPEEQRLFGASLLALLTGGVMIGLGMLRAGVIMNFVSRPVVNAYVTGAAVLIIFSQLRHILGVQASGGTVLELAQSLWAAKDGVSLAALIVGGGGVIFLYLTRKYLAFGLFKLGIKAQWARLAAKLGPFALIVAMILFFHFSKLDDTSGLRIVGEVPSGLPSLILPMAESSLIQQLVVAAFLIGLVGFVDGMSTAQTLAARTRSRVDGNREMLALGASNLASGFSGGYPVNGSMSRTAVSFAAGGKTRMVSIFTAIGMALAALFFTPLLFHLPLATLAALIIVSCFGLIDFKHLFRTWEYSKADGATAFLTFLTVLLVGIEAGVLVGVVLSMAIHIFLTLRPNAVLVGRFPGTEHFRNEDRFDVETYETVKTLRIDESLYYANARYLEDRVAQIISKNPKLEHLILMCPAVNRIDASALNSLMSINKRLDSAGVKLHLSELHSYVTDRLHRSTFFEKLTGQVFMSQHEAMEALAEEPDWASLSDHIDIHG